MHLSRQYEFKDAYFKISGDCNKFLDAVAYRSFSYIAIVVK